MDHEASGLCACVTVGMLLAGCAREVSPPSPDDVFGSAPPADLAIVLETDEGVIDCTIHPARTPNGAALLVGLSRGGYAFRDPRTSEVSTAPLYRDLVFHRTIEDVLVQTGCPLGTGTGTPGYRIPKETRDDDLAMLSRPGALVLATYTRPPNRVDPSPPPPGHVHGSQIAIGIAPLPHLAGTATVLGECEDLDVLRAVSRRPRDQRARLRSLRER